jgi:hypothetical protein
MLASTARVANHLRLDTREEAGGTKYRGAATGEEPSLSARKRDLTPYRPQFCQKKSPNTFSVDTGPARARGWTAMKWDTCRDASPNSAGWNERTAGHSVHSLIPTNSGKLLSSRRIAPSGDSHPQTIRIDSGPVDRASGIR